MLLGVIPSRNAAPIITVSFVADHAAITAAGSDDVIRDQMLGHGHDAWRELPGGHGLDPPWFSGLDRVEVCAIEADYAEKV